MNTTSVEPELAGFTLGVARGTIKTRTLSLGTLSHFFRYSLRIEAKSSAYTMFALLKGVEKYAPERQFHSLVMLN